MKAKRSKRFPFTEHENYIIKHFVKMYGEDWDRISRNLPGRTPKQIHDRYINYLRDGLIKAPWTNQEEQIVITMYQSIGAKWSKMIPYLPGRSGNDIKNRWYKHILKKYRVNSQDNNSFINNGQAQENNSYDCKFDFNSNNLVQMSEQRQNMTNLMAQKESINSAVFPNTRSYVLPIIKKDEIPELVLHHKFEQNKLQDYIKCNEENKSIFDDFSINSENIEQNQDFIGLINKVETKYNEEEEGFLGSELYSEFDSPISDTEFLYKSILTNIDSNNFDLF